MTGLTDTPAPAPDAIPDANPAGGGSFVRNPDGTLTQTSQTDAADAARET